MSRQGLKQLPFAVSHFLLIISLGCASGIIAMHAAAQEPESPVLRGYVTALVPPESFVVNGYRVVTSLDTKYSLLDGKSDQSQSAFRSAIQVGVYVEIKGIKDKSTKTVSADEVLLRDDSGRSVSGAGVIERIAVSGGARVYEVDGYELRVDSKTEVHFAGGITALSDVQTNMWVRFEGQRNGSGDIVASMAHFVKPDFPRRKRDPREVQVTSFPPGSLIDFDGFFSTDRWKHKLEDAGGWCGWYPIPEDPALQERVRRIGMRLAPQIQRDLPGDDPAKIPFRFYVVDEKEIRSEIFCSKGLIMVPLNVVERLGSDDQLAAVLADGVAAEMQMQQERLAHKLGAIGAEFAGAYVAGFVGYGIAKKEIQREMERQRAPLGLSLMADAGYDPWQAPEAWRLLAPGKLPKSLTKLKYPARSLYLLDILHLQYVRQAGGRNSGAAVDAARP